MERLGSLWSAQAFCVCRFLVERSCVIPLGSPDVAGTMEWHRVLRIGEVHQLWSEVLGLHAQSACEAGCIFCISCYQLKEQ